LRIQGCKDSRTQNARAASPAATPSLTSSNP
jgi:hypothetical protein